MKNVCWKIENRLKIEKFRWKKFPKSSGQVNAVLTFLLEPLPKVRTIFTPCQKLFEKLHLFKTLVFQQNFHMERRGMQFSHPSVREFSTRTSKTTKWMCEINDAKTFLSKKLSKTSARQLNAVSATPPIFFDQNSISLKFWNFFRKALLPKFFFWAVQTNPPKYHAEKSKNSRPKSRKNSKLQSFRKQVICQNVSLDTLSVVLAIPTPTHTPTHTPKHFSPEDPKFLSGSPRLKIKIILFKKFFFVKNFSWTNKLQFRQLHPFFCRMLESFRPKHRPVVKSWDFYQKKFFSPKVSVGLVKAGSTTLLKPFCQKA